MTARDEHHALHAAYMRHVRRAIRCACVTGVLCERGRELEINASAAGWRWQRDDAAAERGVRVAVAR